MHNCEGLGHANIVWEAVSTTLWVIWFIYSQTFMILNQKSEYVVLIFPQVLKYKYDLLCEKFLQ